MLRLFFLLLMACSLFISSSAFGKRFPWPNWDKETRLDFGKCLYAEDSSANDWPALGWALVKQWRLKRKRIDGHTFHRQVRWYCSVFERTGVRWRKKRPGKILAATWNKAPYKEDSEAWEGLRGFVDRFEKLKITDPCPSCVWWGGPKCDTIPEHWVCPLGPPKTNNVFCHLSGRPGR